MGKMLDKWTRDDVQAAPEMLESARTLIAILDDERVSHLVNRHDALIELSCLLGDAQAAAVSAKRLVRQYDRLTEQLDLDDEGYAVAIGSESYLRASDDEEWDTAR